MGSVLNNKPRIIKRVLKEDKFGEIRKKIRTYANKIPKAVLCSCYAWVALADYSPLAPTSPASPVTGLEKITV